MKLKNNTIKDFFKIVAWTQKKLLPCSIAYWILLFISLPLLLILGSVSIGRMPEFYLSPLLFLFVMVFSALFPFIALNYMHGKRVTDFFDSLPVTKVTMLFARIFSAAIATILPMIIILIGSFLVLFKGSMVQDVISALCTLVLYSLFNISFVSYICICCGTTVDAIIKYFILNALIPISVLVFNFLPTVCVVGLTDSVIPDNLLVFLSTCLSPITSFWAALFSENPSSYYIVWTIVIVSLIVAGRFIILKRKAETAQTSISFKWPDYIINFACNFICGIVFGWLLALLTESNLQLLFFIIGYLFGSFVPHFIMHIIKNRSLANFSRSLRVFFASTVFALIFCSFIFTNFFGTMNHVPNKNDIASVSISYEHFDKKNDAAGTNSFSSNYKYLPTFDDTEIIETVLKLHHDFNSQILKNKDLISPTSYLPKVASGNGIYIRYNLKNGKKIERFFSLYNISRDEIVEYINLDIFKQKEYIIKATGLHLYPSDAIQSIIVEKKIRNKNDKHSNASKSTLLYPSSNQSCQEVGALLKDITSKDHTVIYRDKAFFDKTMDSPKTEYYYKIKVYYYKYYCNLDDYHNDFFNSNYQEVYYIGENEYPELTKVLESLI